jgi:hypothetical protein
VRGCGLDRRPLRAEKKDKKKKNDKKKSDANKKRKNTIVHGLSIRERPTPCPRAMSLQARHCTPAQR